MASPGHVRGMLSFTDQSQQPSVLLYHALCRVHTFLSPVLVPWLFYLNRTPTAVTDPVGGRLPDPELVESPGTGLQLEEETSPLLP